MNKECELYDRSCIDCGECDKCDMDSARNCNNCGKCLEEEGEYRSLNVNEFLKIKEDKRK